MYYARIFAGLVLFRMKGLSFSVAMRMAPLLFTGLRASSSSSSDTVRSCCSCDSCWRGGSGGLPGVVGNRGNDGPWQYGAAAAWAILSARRANGALRSAFFFGTSATLLAKGSGGPTGTALATLRGGITSSHLTTGGMRMVLSLREWRWRWWQPYERQQPL